MADIKINPFGNEPSLLDSSKTPVSSIILHNDDANSILISDEYYITQKVHVTPAGSYLFKLRLTIDSPIGLKFHPFNCKSKTYNPSDLNNLKVEEGDQILQLVRFFTTEAEYNSVSVNFRNFRIRFATAEYNTADFKSKGIPSGGDYAVNKSGQRAKMSIPTTLIIS
ncbi:MAG: hypothetical protein AAGA77_23635 [Bacteroidota bacterium]